MKLLHAMKLLIIVSNRKYKTKWYSLRCKNIQKNIIGEFQVLVMVNQWYYQNVQLAVVKNQDLSKIKKQKDY